MAYKSLDDFMMEKCRQVCEMMANEVYEVINYFLAQYYEEWTPQYYQRSYDMLHSAFKTEMKKVGNSWQTTVGIDYESLNNYEDATGFEVITWANQGLHGSLDIGTNTHVYDDAIESTIRSGQLLKDCIIFLRGKGLTIVG